MLSEWRIVRGNISSRVFLTESFGFGAHDSIFPHCKLLKLGGSLVELLSMILERSFYATSTHFTLESTLHRSSFGMRYRCKPCSTQPLFNLQSTSLTSLSPLSLSPPLPIPSSSLPLSPTEFPSLISLQRSEQFWRSALRSTMRQMEDYIYPRVRRLYMHTCFP